MTQLDSNVKNESIPIKTEIIMALRDFTFECLSDKTLVSILEFFGQCNVNDSSLMRIIVSSCMNLFYLSLSLTVKQAALHSLMLISLTNSNVKQDVMIFLDR